MIRYHLRCNKSVSPKIFDLWNSFPIQAVELCLVDKAVLPIENSIDGSIHRNYDLLLCHNLHIVGEVQLPINHCLLALPGVVKEDLKRVLSHPLVVLYLCIYFIPNDCSFINNFTTCRHLANVKRP